MAVLGTAHRKAPTMSLRVRALLLATTLTLASPVTAQAAPAPNKADKAADWLAGELDNNRVHG